MAQGDDISYSVNSGQRFAYYSRYEGMGNPHGPSSAEDLLCPHCGAEEIIIIEEHPTQAERMIGDLAECWMCKKQFRITGNCWKFRPLNNP